MSNFDKKMEDLANNYEKGFDKHAPKIVNAVAKIGRGANKLYIGCITIIANLFFMAFCLWGVYAASVSWRLETNGETTTGIVTSLDEQSDTNSGCCTYVPIVEFEVGGSAYSLRGDTASNPPQFEVGEQVPVLYDPLDPNTAQINKWSQRWIFPIMIIPSMIFGSLLVTFFMIRAWRRGENVISSI